jgi:hypothetical protein
MRRFAMTQSPWGLPLAFLGNTQPDKTEREPAGGREQMAGCLKEFEL